MADLLDRLSICPQLARTLARHVAAVDAGSVPRRTKELCALMVSWLCACRNCIDVHAGLARDLGVEAAALQDLGDFGASERFSLPERAALSAAVALTREPRALPPAVRSSLNEFYDEAQVVEIVATIGLYNYLARVSNALS